MAAPVRISARAWGDIRFSTLARILGLADADHALIKVARLWSWQTERFESDRPTYEIDRDTIESVLGVGGPEALVRARLATETSSGWRMHGTEGEIEWCQQLTSKRAKAGKARADTARRGDDGRLICNAEHVGPAHDQHTTSTRPAQSSAPALVPSPVPDIRNPPPACAIHSVAVPDRPAIPTTPASERLDRERAARRVVQLEIREELERVRGEVASQIGVTDHGLLAQDPGELAIEGHLVLAGPNGLAKARGQALHAIEMAKLETIASPRKFQWFTGAIFSEKNFRRLVATTASEAKRLPEAKTGRFGKPEPASMPQPAKFVRTAPLADPVRDASEFLELYKQLEHDGARAPPASASAIADEQQHQPEPKAET